MIKKSIIGMLEKALNHYLHLDPETITRLAAFSGKVIAVEETQFKLTFYLLITATGIQLSDQHSGASTSNFYPGRK